MRKMLLVLFVCLTALTGLTSCSLLSKDVKVHVIDGKDYHEEKDAKGNVTFVCLTPDTFQEIAKARLEK